MMAILIPIPGTEISTINFGRPVATEVNRLTDNDAQRPLGIIAQVFSTTQLTNLPNATNTDIPGASLSFTAVANRRYRVTFGCAFAGPAAAYASVGLNNVGTQYAVGSLAISSGTAFGHLVYATTFFTKARAGYSLPAGVIPLRLVAWCSPAGVGVFAGNRDPSFIVVDDMGPDA